MTDQTFTSYAFEAEDSPTKRTTPERLSEIVNVKDWGALGNGSHDDTNNIRAAIDFAYTLGRVSHHGAIVFFPPGTYWITSTINFDGSVGGGLVHYRGAGRDASIIRGNYNFTEAQQEENPDSFLVRGAGIGSIRDLTIWNESTSPTSGALMMDVCSNDRYIENCHFKGMTGFVCASVGFGYRLTDCIMTCSKPPTLASDPNRSPLFNDQKFYSGYIVSGNATSNGTGVTGFTSIKTQDTSNNLIDSTRGVGYTPNHSFDLTFYAPGFVQDSSILPENRARAHAVSNSAGIITLADIVLDFAGIGYSYQPIFAINHSNIYGGVGAYVGQALVSNCHATGFDIGFSVIGGALSLKSCSATQCGIGYACAFLNGSRSVGALDAEISPGRWYQLYSGDLMSCVADRCTQGIYCYSARGMFAANRITGSTGPYVPASIESMVYIGAISTVIVTGVADHNLTGPTAIVQIDPPSLTDDPNGFVTVELATAGTGYTKQFSYIKSTPLPVFAPCTWNYPLEHGVNCRNSDGSWFVANAIDAKVSKASFVANGGTDGNNVWCSRGDYGWTLADNNADSYSASLWDFKKCGGGTTLARPGTNQFPAIPWIKRFPAEQTNIPGASIPGAEINFISGQAGLGFGDVLYAYMDLTVFAPAGSTILTFAAVPPGVISAGMTVGQYHPPHLQIGTVSTFSTTTVTISPPTPGDMVPGTRINFLRTGTTHYKIRYDGEAWRVVAR